MERKNLIFKGNGFFMLVIFAYLGIGFFLLRYYLYGLCPDGISYLSIAQKYLRGDFSNAVNGYWGPLISWLLVPLLFCGLSPLWAIKFLSLLLGLLVIIGVRLLSYRFQITEEIKNILFIALIPIVLDYSLTSINADLLLMCVLVYYLYFMFDPEYSLKSRNGVFCGALGCAMYLAKPYGFSFFILHFSLFNFLHYFNRPTQTHRNNTLRNFFLGAVIFLCISGIWIFMLSHKYKEFTIETTGRFNYAAVGPQYNMFSQIPISRRGFFKPPNETAISIWENPSGVKSESWSPLESQDYFRYQLKLTLKNIHRIAQYMLQKVSLFSAVIIFGYILFCIMPFKRLISENWRFYPLLTLALYPAGYYMIYVVDKYLWINCIILLLMGADILAILCRSNFFAGAKKEIAKIALVLSFLILPFYHLILSFNDGRDIYNLSRVLKSYGIHGRVASNNTNAPTNKNWHITLYLSYYLGNHYYGEPLSKIDDAELQDFFMQNDIDYYFFWEAGAKIPPFLLKYKEKIGVKIPDLRIYSLKEKA
jgi:hypothetical protein